MDNFKSYTESLKNKTKHMENIWDLYDKERCLYIYFPLGNNYGLLNLIIKKPIIVTVLSAHYLYIANCRI